MKLNGFSIFGISLISIGGLFLVFAVVMAMRTRAPVANSSATGGINDWAYVAIGVGMVMTGIIIAFLGQGRRSAKDPAAPL